MVLGYFLKQHGVLTVMVGGYKAFFEMREINAMSLVVDLSSKILDSKR